ncbi:MAG: polyprenyl synthetase family protein [Verrucomicrobiales bacterium]
MTLSDHEFDVFKRRVRERVEIFLEERFVELPDTEVSRIAQHILLGGGRRWRAMLVIAAGHIFERDALDACLPGAAALEMAHAASMLLDDLPSMDDASIRRGKPCAHLLFDSWAIDMAPSFMINMAYEVTLRQPGIDPARRVQVALEAASAANRMVSGQQADLIGLRAASTRDQLMECYAQKSGSLYACAAKSGAILCGAGEKDAERLFRIGSHLGLAYQIMDDIADVEATLDQLGKAPGMDEGKFTAPTVLGLEESRFWVEDLQDQALEGLESFGDSACHLLTLVRRASVVYA